MERYRTPAVILAILTLLLCVVFAVLGKLALIPAILIGLLALAFIL